MKKMFALLLCAALVLGLCACSAEKEESSALPEETQAETEAPSSETAPSTEAVVPEETPSETEAPHVHVNYKGLDHVYTQEDMEKAEGKPCDFVAGEGEDALYIYNGTTADGMNFTQVQHTFHENYNRISCTYSADTGTEEVMASYLEVLTGIYGDAAHQEGHDHADLWTWMDHTGNYIILTRINEETIQVAYYIYAQA